MELIVVFVLSLVHLCLLPGAAAARIKLMNGSSFTFYCQNSLNLYLKSCDCSYYNRICSKVDSTRIKIEQNFKITFHDLTPSDSGCYQCNNKLTDWDLTILPEKDPSVVIGKLGGSAVMSCSFGEKTFEKHWCREVQNGSCLKINHNNERGSFRIDDKLGTFSLVKWDLSPKDSGKYRCAYNWEPKSSHTIDLQVLQNDNGLSAPSTVNVMPGQHIKVTCKYIQEYANEFKYWTCSKTRCYLTYTDDHTRSELVLSIYNVGISDNKKIYTCKVNKFDGSVSQVNVTIMVGLTAPEHIYGSKGGQVKIQCDYNRDYNLEVLSLFWCKLESNGTCKNVKKEKVTIEDFYFYFVVTMKHLEMNDAGLYRCGYEYKQWNREKVKVTADVRLSVVGPQLTYRTTVSTTASAVTKEKDTKTFLASQPLRSNVLLICVIVLLLVVIINCLILLLKMYCKRFSERVQSPELGGGTFHMSDLKNNTHVLSPDLSVPQQPYTGTMDDSSSTSSESSGHSFGNISSGPRPQYLTIVPSPMNPDYENVVDEMHPALSDYENVTTDVEQDYVNVPEAPNLSLTEDQKCEIRQPSKNCDEVANSSESSSDESEESVNYSTVIFTKTTEQVLRGPK